MSSSLTCTKVKVAWICAQASEWDAGATTRWSERERALHLPPTPAQTLHWMHQQPRRRQQGNNSSKTPLLVIKN